MMGVLNNGADLRYRCCEGADLTGDIYNPANVDDIVQLIRTDSATWPSHPGNQPLDKVHLAVCDGGFDAQRDSENQEDLCVRLVACQAAASLRVIGVGGTVVLKYFGSSLPLTRQILCLLGSHFTRVLVVKPVSSRPASAERYIVCQNLLQERSDQIEETSRLINLMGSAGSFESAAIENDLLSEASLPLLSNYLEEMDVCVLNLNVLAIEAILRVLRKASGKGESGVWSSGRKDGVSERLPLGTAVDLESVLDVEERRALWGGRVNVEEYRSSWKLP